MARPGAHAETIRVQPARLAFGRAPSPPRSPSIASVVDNAASSDSESAFSVDREMFHSISNKSKTRPKPSHAPGFRDAQQDARQHPAHSRQSRQSDAYERRRQERRVRFQRHANSGRRGSSASESESESDLSDASDETGSSDSALARAHDTFESAGGFSGPKPASRSGFFGSTKPAIRPSESRVAKESRIEGTLGALKLEVPDLDKLNDTDLDKLDEKLRIQSAREQALNLMRRGMIIFVAVVEHAHTYFNPELKYLLEGWSMEVFNDLHAYDRHLLQVYDHYATAAPLHPLLGFTLALCGSAVMYAMTKSFMRFSIESMRGFTDPVHPPSSGPAAAAPPPPYPMPYSPAPPATGVPPPPPSSPSSLASVPVSVPVPVPQGGPAPLRGRSAGPSPLFGMQSAGPTSGHPLANNPLMGAMSGLMNSGALGPIMDGLVGAMMQQQPHPQQAPGPSGPRPSTANTSVRFQAPPSLATGPVGGVGGLSTIIEEQTSDDDIKEMSTRIRELPMAPPMAPMAPVAHYDIPTMSPPRSPVFSDDAAMPGNVLERLQAEEDATAGPLMGLMGPMGPMGPSGPSGTSEESKTSGADVFQISLD